MFYVFLNQGMRLAFSKFPLSKASPGASVSHSKDFTCISEDCDPSFSILQSNILFCLYFLGCLAVFVADILIQNAQYWRSCSSYWSCTSQITRVSLLIFIFNIILWIDFNFHWYRRKKRNEKYLPQSKGMFEELIEEITDPLYILIVTLFYWFIQKIR